MVRFEQGDVIDRAGRDLKQRVINYLVGRNFPALRRLTVDADNGRVVIQGKVGSYYEKQLCLNCSRRVAGVIELVDRVEVALS